MLVPAVTMVRPMSCCSQGALIAVCILVPIAAAADVIALFKPRGAVAPLYEMPHIATCARFLENAA